MFEVKDIKSKSILKLEDKLVQCLEFQLFPKIHHNKILPSKIKHQKNRMRHHNDQSLFFCVFRTKVGRVRKKQKHFMKYKFWVYAIFVRWVF